MADTPSTQPPGLPPRPRTAESVQEPVGAAILPSFPPRAAGEPANTQASPAGPGKPIDGSQAVNTYTPEVRQAAEFKAGDQDWPALVATGAPDIKLKTEDKAIAPADKVADKHHATQPDRKEDHKKVRTKPAAPAPTPDSAVATEQPDAPVTPAPEGEVIP